MKQNLLENNKAHILNNMPDWVVLFFSFSLHFVRLRRSEMQEMETLKRSTKNANQDS